ncbi:MAG: acetolactate synthase [Verrucomicrobiota bacterium]|nr:acetolactate synthase [Verrucomicrobiota bacterium]
MTFESTQTVEKLGGPRVTQFSIFLKNRVGALLEVVRLLNESTVHVLAVSVQDSADTAIVRIVVSDPESVQKVFHERNVPFSVCELVVVELKEGATELGRLLAALLAAECNIFGSYALLTRPRGRPALALHVEDNECAASVLQGQQFRILSQSDISR